MRANRRNTLLAGQPRGEGALRAWVRPSLTRLDAGAAEILASTASDGVSTQS